MYTIHNHYSKDNPNFGFYGVRGEIDLRINSGTLNPNENLIDPIHYHKEATVYFIVTEGALEVEINGHVLTINQDIVCEIKPTTPYRTLKAVGNEVCKWICINTKNTADDRVEII